MRRGWSRRRSQLPNAVVSRSMRLGGGISDAKRKVGPRCMRTKCLLAKSCPTRFVRATSSLMGTSMWFIFYRAAQKADKKPAHGISGLLFWQGIQELDHRNTKDLFHRGGLEGDMRCQCAKAINPLARREGEKMKFDFFVLTIFSVGIFLR